MPAFSIVAQSQRDGSGPTVVRGMVGACPLLPPVEQSKQISTCVVCDHYGTFRQPVGVV